MEITGSTEYRAAVVMKPVDGMARAVAIHPEMRRTLQEWYHIILDSKP